MTDPTPEADAGARSPDRPAEHLGAVPRLAPVDGSFRDAEAEEPLGGDPPCWAHLFDDDAEPR
jgi:hypothetical protein